MPARDEADALEWAKREHRSILTMERMIAEGSSRRTFIRDLDRARKMRNLALVDLWLFRGKDPAVVTSGTDAEISAFLDAQSAPTRPSAVALVDAAARRAGGAA